MIEIVTPGLTMDEKEHIYRLNGQVKRSVTQVINEIMGKPFYPPGNYAERGKFTHLACHYFDLGRQFAQPLDPGIIDYFRGWVKFRMEYEFEPILSETMLWWSGGCAGTLDKFGKIGNRFTVLDIKTGGWGTNTDLQLAGYKKLLLAQPQIAKLVKGKSIDMLEVRLPGDGTYQPKPYPEVGQTAAFESFVYALNWKYR